MKTIMEVFAGNLKRLRGSRSQADVAEAAGIPMRTYQNAEYGRLPQDGNLAAIATALGVPETHLFVDLDEFGPRSAVTPHEALEVLRRAIEALPASWAPILGAFPSLDNDEADYIRRKLADYRSAKSGEKASDPSLGLRKSR